MKEYVFPLGIILVLTFLLGLIAYSSVAEAKVKKAEFLKLLQKTYENGYIDCAKDVYQKNPLKAKLIENPDGSKYWIYEK